MPGPPPLLPPFPTASAAISASPLTRVFPF